MEFRGHDATGFVTVSPNGYVQVRKDPLCATDFLTKRRGIGAASVLTLIHTRAWTQGSPNDPNNNHPIVSGNVVGIHNGMIDNDDTLYRENPTWNRFGAVDSEVIFTALDHYDDERKALEQIEGWMAIAWIDVRDPKTLRLATGNASPLNIAVTPNGSMFFASTMHALTELVRLDLIDHWEWATDVDEGKIMHYAPGMGSIAIEEWEPPQRRSWSAGSFGGHTNYVPKKGGSWVKNDKGEWVQQATAITVLGLPSGGPDPFDLDDDAWDVWRETGTSHLSTADAIDAFRAGDQVQDTRGRIGTIEFIDGDECLVNWKASVECLESLSLVSNDDAYYHDLCNHQFVTGRRN